MSARPTSTDQPSSGRSSSSTFPLQVSGRAVPEVPPAPWKPIVAVWPLAPALIGSRYLTLITFERSWIWTCPFTLSPVAATRFSWKSMMKVRFGLVPDVP